MGLFIFTRKLINLKKTVDGMRSCFLYWIYRELYSVDAIGNDKSDKKRSFFEGHLYAVVGIVSFMRTERLNSQEKNWWIKDDGIEVKKHASRIWHQMRCLWIDWIFDLSISSNLRVSRRIFPYTIFFLYIFMKWVIKIGHVPFILRKRLHGYTVHFRRSCHSIYGRRRVRKLRMKLHQKCRSF